MTKRDAPDLETRVRAEYLEMPGLSLTPAQACRLFGIDLDICKTMMEALESSRFLFRAGDGTFRKV